MFLDKFKKTPGAKLIIVSFSPTGGGHTGRLLDIVKMALEMKSISRDSIVIFHLPCLWEGNARSPLVSVLASKLLENNVAVLIAESDKSIYGYLNKETGGSDDASILQRISRFPLSDTQTRLTTSVENHKTIARLTGCIPFTKDTDINNLPVISAKNLMSNIHCAFGTDVVKERCYILTDMDPYLQKAAIAAGVPGKRCLDQQNHAILLNLTDAQLNLLPEYALLSKVLGGYGETISHIDLGGRNTLNSLVQITEKLKIYSGTPKWLARVKVADLLMSYALTTQQINTRLADPNKPFSGVVAGSAVKYGGDARNIVYVYAHKKTNTIANCVIEKIRNGAPEFEKIIFLFCGTGAVGHFNAMHLAYMADADGITTAGAGTVGEFAYLRKRADCGSRLLILPIEGHNEQEKNADVLSKDKEIASFIIRTLEQECLSESLQRFVSSAPKISEAPRIMSEFIAAVSDTNSYVQQAYELLFTDTPTVNFKNIIDVEQTMNRSPLLRATRRYIKVIFQALDMVDNNPHGEIKIALKQGETIIFPGLEKFNNTLHNSIELAKIIGLKTTEEVNKMPLLEQVKRHFSTLSRGKSGSNSLHLKEEFGEFMITGF